MSNLTLIIERIRELAGQAAEIDVQLDKQFGIDRTLGIDYWDPKSVERRYATNTALEDMAGFLNTLDEETLRRVEAVMYSGRGGGAPAVDERDVLRENHPTKEDVVRNIIEKRPNFEVYFSRGLERAEAPKLTESISIRSDNHADLRAQPVRRFSIHK